MSTPCPGSPRRSWRLLGHAFGNPIYDRPRPRRVTLTYELRRRARLPLRTARRPRPPRAAGAVYPVAGSGRLVAEDGLDLEELLEPVLAPLPSVARLLVAPEGSGEVTGSPVDADLTGAQLGRHAARVREVTRMHVAGEAVHRVVRHLDGLGLVAIGHDREHGTEDLLAGDRHVRRDVGEHRRPHVVAPLEAFRPAGPARDQRGSLAHACLDQPLDLV